MNDDPYDFSWTTFKFVPTEPAWSTNQDRKMNIHERHRHVKAWKAAARQGWKLFAPQEKRGFVRQHGAPFLVVQVEIPFLQRRRRDPHNYCGTVVKAVIDGLVEEGLWPDDTPEHVGHREPLTRIGTEGLIHLFEE